MGKVHAHGSRLAQDRKDRIAGKKLRTQAKRIVVRVAGAEHPLVPQHAAHAAAHLVSQSLKAERSVAGRQRAGNGSRGPIFVFCGQKNLNGLLKPTLEQVLKAGKRNQRRRRCCRKVWNMKTMDCVEKEECSYSLVEVVTVPAKPVEFLAFAVQFSQSQTPAQVIQRDIALVAVAGNDFSEPAHEEALPPLPRNSRSAKSSTICESTSLRSRPLSASASCAIRSPYGAPRS